MRPLDGITVVTLEYAIAALLPAAMSAIERPALAGSSRRPVPAPLPPGATDAFAPCMNVLPALGQHTETILESLASKGAVPEVVVAAGQFEHDDGKLTEAARAYDFDKHEAM